MEEKRELSIHLHFAVNTVSYCTGMKISISAYDIRNMKNEMEHITEFYISFRD